MRRRRRRCYVAPTRRRYVSIVMKKYMLLINSPENIREFVSLIPILRCRSVISVRYIINFTHTYCLISWFWLIRMKFEFALYRFCLICDLSCLFELLNSCELNDRYFLWLLWTSDLSCLCNWPISLSFLLIDWLIECRMCVLLISVDDCWDLSYLCELLPLSRFVDAYS